MAFAMKRMLGFSQLIQIIRDSFLPIGTVVYFHGKTTDIPYGWAVCDGQNGTPNLIENYVYGSWTSGTIRPAGLPNITGGIIWNYGSGNSLQGNGAFRLAYGGYDCGDTDRHRTQGMNFDASRCSAIYGRSDTVTPPSVSLIPIMKIK